MAQKKFFDLFPPPNFLTMPAAGISIGEDAIRYIHLKSRNGVVALADFGEEKLPEGSIVDGVPVKTDQIIAALKKLKENHRISFVNIALPEDKAYVFRATVSVPAGANLADSVGFILEENIPLSPSQTIFDFAVVGQNTGAPETINDEVVVSAFPQDVIESYLDICKQSDIKVLQFDIESEAIAKSVILPGDEATRLIVHFAPDKVVLAIVSHSTLQYVSVVNSNKETSAEPVTLRDEIKKVCAYWQSERIAERAGVSVQTSTSTGKKKSENKVESIIVSGDVDPKQNIVAYLSKQIGVPANLGNVWQNVFSLDETIPKITFEDSLRFAPAIGLALSGIGKQNV